jgi:hypothetical protein
VNLKNIGVRVVDIKSDYPEKTVDLNIESTRSFITLTSVNQVITISTPELNEKAFLCIRLQDGKLILSVSGTPKSIDQLFSKDSQLKLIGSPE